MSPTNDRTFKVNLIDDVSSSQSNRLYCPHDYHALIFRAEYKSFFCPICGHIAKENSLYEQEEEKKKTTDGSKSRIITANGYTQTGKEFTNEFVLDPLKQVVAAPVNVKSEAFDEKVVHGISKTGDDRDIARLKNKGYNIVSSWEYSEEVDTFNPSYVD